MASHPCRISTSITSTLFLVAALCNGVRSSYNGYYCSTVNNMHTLSLASILAPCLISILIIAILHLSTALCKGVHPSCNDNSIFISLSYNYLILNINNYFF